MKLAVIEYLSNVDVHTPTLKLGAAKRFFGPAAAAAAIRTRLCDARVGKAQPRPLSS